MAGGILSGLTAFVDGLIPSFKKNRLPEKLDTTFKGMSTVVAIYNMDGRDRTLQMTLEDNYPTMIRGIERRCNEYRGNFVDFVYRTAVDRINDRADLLAVCDEAFGPKISKNDLTYRQTQLLQYTTGLGFFVLYARKLMMQAYNDLIDDPSIVSPIDHEDEEFLENVVNQRNFAIIVSAMQLSAKDIGRATVNLSNLIYDESTYEYVKRDNKGGLDPLKIGLLPIIGDLAYAIGSSVSEYFVNQIERDKAEAEKLKIQVLLMRRKLDGVVDKDSIEKLKKSIAYYNDRINKLAMEEEDILDN